MLLTFSHCFWKGKQSLHFAAQTVAEGPQQSRGASGNGAHDLFSTTHWAAADSPLGGREGEMSILVPGPSSLSSGLTDGGVSDDHVLYYPKAKYRKLRKIFEDWILLSSLGTKVA